MLDAKTSLGSAEREDLVGRCFVMQPFDGGQFDKRFDSVFAPAIEEAGLKPYRVDRDPAVNIPIEDIEAGIRQSDLCLAEITTDNPNVWFELGYAIAVPREVVLVCSDERTSRFPFDVQHRRIIKYKTESPQDFDELKTSITQRICAMQEKQAVIGVAASISLVKNTEGLSQHEVVALVSIMQNNFIGPGDATGWNIKSDMQRAGFTDIAIALALKTLRAKRMISMEVRESNEDPPYYSYAISTDGEQWLLSNQDKLVLQREEVITTEEVPF